MPFSITPQDLTTEAAETQLRANADKIFIFRKSLKAPGGFMLSYTGENGAVIHAPYKKNNEGNFVKDPDGVSLDQELARIVAAKLCDRLNRANAGNFELAYLQSKLVLTCNDKGVVNVNVQFDGSNPTFRIGKEILNFDQMALRAERQARLVTNMGTPTRTMPNNRTYDVVVDSADVSTSANPAMPQATSVNTRVAFSTPLSSASSSPRDVFRTPPSTNSTPAAPASPGVRQANAAIPAPKLTSGLDTPPASPKANSSKLAYGAAVKKLSSELAQINPNLRCIGESNKPDFSILYEQQQVKCKVVLTESGEARFNVDGKDKTLAEMIALATALLPARELPSMPQLSELSDELDSELLNKLGINYYIQELAHEAEGEGILLKGIMSPEIEGFSLEFETKLNSNQVEYFVDGESRNLNEIAEYVLESSLVSKLGEGYFVVPGNGKDGQRSLFNDEANLELTFAIKEIGGKVKFVVNGEAKDLNAMVEHVHAKLNRATNSAVAPVLATAAPKVSTSPTPSSTTTTARKPAASSPKLSSSAIIRTATADSAGVSVKERRAKFQEGVAAQSEATERPRANAPTTPAANAPTTTPSPTLRGAGTTRPRPATPTAATTTATATTTTAPATTTTSTLRNRK